MTQKQEVAAIPLVEERITVGKQSVESGRVRVRVEVDRREEKVAQELVHDEVDIERVPKNIPLTELPSVRLEGTTTIIPVVEEVLVVEKQLMLVEEIHLHKRTVSQTTDVPIVIRSERAIIDDADAGAQQPARASEE